MVRPEFRCRILTTDRFQNCHDVLIACIGQQAVRQTDFSDLSACVIAIFGTLYLDVAQGGTSLCKQNVKNDAVRTEKSHSDTILQIILFFFSFGLFKIALGDVINTLSSTQIECQSYATADLI